MTSHDSLEALVGRILATKAFYPSPQRTALFKYLWEHRHEVSEAINIWEVALLPNSPAPDKNDPEHDFRRTVRQSYLDLKRELGKYFAGVKHGWYIDLPPAQRGLGYRLRILRLDDPDSPTMAFWRPHVDEAPVSLVYAQPMFYLDVETGCHLRFLDTNPQPHQDPLLELQERHGKELQELYGELYRDTSRQRLRPTHAYLATGDVAALDALAQWFHDRPWVAVRKMASDSIDSLQEVSPVLIGSPRTNKFIFNYLTSEAGKHFCYRVHESKLFHILVHSAKPREEQALQPFLCVDEEEKQKGNIVAGMGMSLSVERTRLVILMRMPKPEGNGTVTMIVSDAPPAIKQLALTLTSDKQVTPILEALDYPEPLPSSFEMLFAVKVAPGKIDNHTAPAQLLAIRRY